MCHNTALENEQIDKCVENGMPEKIIKTIKYTMRRRVAEAVVVQEEDQPQPSTELQQHKDSSKIANEKSKQSSSFQMKCPFGHGLIRPPTSTASQEFPATLSENAEVQFSSMYERIPFASTTNTLDSTGITNLNGHNDVTTSSSPDASKVYNDDILAKGTQYTKELTLQMQQAIGKLQQSKFYTLLTKTAQPAHVLAICILSFVMFTIWPEVLNGKTAQHKSTSEVTRDYLDASSKKNYTLAVIAYLGAFSTHFGAQIWMTFVSGLSLYFSLPRHMFGQCQQILFPKYFALNGMLSITMLIIYVKFFVQSWTMPQCIQFGALSLTGAIEILVRLYLAPPLLYLMNEKYKIEGTIGSGKEVGSLVQGDLVQCPHYQRIHKAFRRIHMTVAMGNLITMAASCLHLYYIAGQIQISI